MLDPRRFQSIIDVYMEKEASKASKAMKINAMARAVKAERKAVSAAKAEHSLSRLSNVPAQARGASAREVSRTLNQASRADALGLASIADKLKNKGTAQILNKNKRVLKANEKRKRQIISVLRSRREGLIDRANARGQIGKIVTRARPNRSNRAALQLDRATPGAKLPYSGTTELRTSNFVGSDGTMIRRADPKVVARAQRNASRNPNNLPATAPFREPVAVAAPAAAKAGTPWGRILGAGASLGLGGLAWHSALKSTVKAHRARKLAIGGAGVLGAGALGAGLYSRR